MNDSPARDRLQTHEVTNQPPPRGDLDLWGGDPALRDHAAAAGADAARLADFGATMGTARCARRGATRAATRPNSCLSTRAGGGSTRCAFTPPITI